MLSQVKCALGSLYTCELTCDEAKGRRVPCVFAGKMCPAITSTCDVGYKFHKEAFTHRSRYEQKPIHRKAFTQKKENTFRQKDLSRQLTLHTEAITHTETFTRRSRYTQKPLHTEAVIHRNIYTEKCHKKPLQQETFRQRNLYRQ